MKNELTATIGELAGEELAVLDREADPVTIATEAQDVNNALPVTRPKATVNMKGALSRNTLADLLHSNECTLDKLTDVKTVRGVHRVVEYDLANDVCAEVLGGYILGYEAQDKNGQEAILQALAAAIQPSEGEALPTIGETDKPRQKMLSILFFNRPDLLVKDENSVSKADRRATYYVRKWKTAHDPMIEANEAATVAKFNSMLDAAGGVTIDEKTGEVVDPATIVAAATDAALTKEAEALVDNPPNADPVETAEKIKFAAANFIWAYQNADIGGATPEVVKDRRTFLVNVYKRMPGLNEAKFRKVLADVNQRLIEAHAALTEGK